MQATSPCSSDTPADVLAGRYRLLSVLGSGGFGTVYAAEDLSLGCRVALKVLKRTKFSHHTIKRLVREAQSLSRLKHPNIVEVHHFGTAFDGRPFIVMDLIEGQTLRQRLSEYGALDTSSATKICIQLAEALRHAHDAGVVHRDVKPENVLVDNDGLAFLVDFGVGLIAESEQTRLTHSGGVVGTAEYMSPERLDGRVDERSDIYSLGCIYFEMLTGVSAFGRESALSTVWAQANDPIPTLSIQAINRIVQKSTAKDPDERYQSCAEILSDLYAVDARSYKRAIQLCKSPSRSRLRLQQALKANGLMQLAIAFLLGLAAFFCFTTVRNRSSQPTEFALHAEKLYEVMAAYTERYDKASDHRNVPFTPAEVALVRREIALLNSERYGASTTDLKQFALQMLRYRQTMHNTWGISPQVLRTMSKFMIDGTKLFGTERGPEQSVVAMEGLWALGLDRLRRDGEDFDRLTIDADELLKVRDRSTLQMLPKYYALRGLRALDKHDWQNAMLWKQRVDRLKNGSYTPEERDVLSELDRRILGLQSGKPQPH